MLHGIGRVGLRADGQRTRNEGDGIVVAGKAAGRNLVSTDSVVFFAVCTFVVGIAIIKRTNEHAGIFIVHEAVVRYAVVSCLVAVFDAVILGGNGQRRFCDVAFERESRIRQFIVVIVGSIEGKTCHGDDLITAYIFVCKRSGDSTARDSYLVASNKRCRTRDSGTGRAVVHLIIDTH